MNNYDYIDAKDLCLSDKMLINTTIDDINNEISGNYLSSAFSLSSQSNPAEKLILKTAGLQKMRMTFINEETSVPITVYALISNDIK